MNPRAAALRQQAEAYEVLARGLRLEADALDAEGAPTPVALYMPVGSFAARVSMSERTIWSFVKKGLPTVGSGRGRRVDVARADEWLRDRPDLVNSGVEQQARAAARAAASRGAR